MSDTQEEVLKSADQIEANVDAMGRLPEETISEVTISETIKSMGSVKVSDTKPSEDPIHENEEEQNPEEGAGITLPPVPEEAGDTPVADIADGSPKKESIGEPVKTTLGGSGEEAVPAIATNKRKADIHVTLPSSPISKKAKTAAPTHVEGEASVPQE
eukprot:190143_1